MTRNALLGVVAVLLLAACSQGGVLISAQGQPTAGLPGYSTITLTASTNDGSQIQGFDFASLSTYGIFSNSMHQVNPGGQPTIFQDNNAFFPFVGADISQDSQFKFLSTNLTVPAGFASESSTQLRAVFAASAPLGTSVPFAQIVTNSIYQVLGQVQTVVGGAVSDNLVNYSPCLDCSVPDITDEVIDNVNANVPGFVNHQIQVSAPGSLITIGNFQFDSYVPAPGSAGSGPANAATLNFSSPSMYFFNWNTVGSPLGTYKWTFTASTFAGHDDGSLTVRITAVPEPSMLSLCIIVCCSSQARMRRRGK